MTARASATTSTRRKGRFVQQELAFPKTWGGARPGAGRKPSGARGSTPHRGATRARRRASRSRDAAVQFSPAAQPTRFSDAMPRHPRRHAAGYGAISRAPLFGSVGSRAFRGRGERQAGSLGGRAQHCDSHRAHRKRAHRAKGALLGGSLARPRAHVTARGAKRTRLRAREFSKTREAPAWPRGRCVFVGVALRRLSWRRGGCRVASRRAAVSSRARNVRRRERAANLARWDGLAARRAHRRGRSAARVTRRIVVTGDATRASSSQVTPVAPSSRDFFGLRRSKLARRPT